LRRFALLLMILTLALSVTAPLAFADDHKPKDEPEKPTEPVAEPTEDADDGDAEAEAEEAEEAKKEEPKYKQTFEDATKETELLEGFFDVYDKDGSVLLTVEPDQMGMDFAMVFEISQGIGARGLNGGTMLNIFEPELVHFEQHGKSLYLVERPYHMTASDEQMAAAVELGFGSSVIAVAEIETEREDGALLIDIKDWLLSDDLTGISRGLGFVLSDTPGQPARVSLDAKKSYIDYVKSFPENTRFNAKLNFNLPEPPEFNSLADWRNMPLGIHTNFVRLPDEPMEPRLADDRMGYFMTVHKDFSRDKKEWFTRYANHWRLEKGKKRGSLYEPKEPIVYYLDQTIPKKYRKAMKKGVENWNKAFEAAGWKDAIRCEMLPDDADPEDIRYSTLRWVATDEPSYLAIGPSVVDPRTGETLDADILFDGSFVLRVEREWANLVDPVTAVELLFDEDEAFKLSGYRGEHACFAAHMGMHAGTARAALLAQGAIAPGDPMPEEFMEQFLLWVTMHEVGHTLGLRHNFRSSSDTPMEMLHDKAWTQQNGLVSSVMDYAAPNLAPGGADAGLWYGTDVGTSDEWVIAYGYTPDAKRAEGLARLGAAAGHAFGDDGDRAGRGAMDPTVNAWDLGSDPLAWSIERTGILSGLLPKVASYSLGDNSPPADLTAAVEQLLGAYGASMGPAVKYIGGQFVYRDHVGDPNGRPPFVPVSREKQQAALNHIIQRVFESHAFELPDDVLAKLGARRWSQWGMSNNINGRIDYPYHEMVNGVQRVILAMLTDPMRLSRMADAELKFGSDEVLTLPELFTQLEGAIWEELDSTRMVGFASTRRNLQRIYVDRLSTLVVNEPDRLPADARSLARQRLRSLGARVDAALETHGARYDEYTKAHLHDVSDRVALALEASLSTRLN